MNIGMEECGKLRFVMFRCGSSAHRFRIRHDCTASPHCLHATTEQILNINWHSSFDSKARETQPRVCLLWECSSLEFPGESFYKLRGAGWLCCWMFAKYRKWWKWKSRHMRIVQTLLSVLTTTIINHHKKYNIIFAKVNCSLRIYNGRQMGFQWEMNEHLGHTHTPYLWTSNWVKDIANTKWRVVVKCDFGAAPQ